IPRHLFSPHFPYPLPPSFPDSLPTFRSPPSTITTKIPHPNPPPLRHQHPLPFSSSHFISTSRSSPPPQPPPRSHHRAATTAQPPVAAGSPFPLHLPAANPSHSRHPAAACSQSSPHHHSDTTTEAIQSPLLSKLVIYPISDSEGDGA
ncbi:hypothetical protein AKJ16_DCAP00993, partial [Drosera capensis]